MKYFTPTNELLILRNQYRDLAKKYHPDLNPTIDVSIMQEINNEYEQLLDAINNERGWHFTMENENIWQSKLVEMLKSFASINDVLVESIGDWIWISGETKPIKEKLKELGFKWAGKKVAWYWKNYRYFKKTNKKFELDELREMFGSEKFEGNNSQQHNLITA